MLGYNISKIAAYVSLLSASFLPDYAFVQKAQGKFLCSPFIEPSKGEVIIDVLDREDRTSLEVVVGKSRDSVALIKIMREKKKCPPDEYYRALEETKKSKR